MLSGQFRRLPALAMYSLPMRAGLRLSILLRDPLSRQIAHLPHS
jgi:hypothetical protein